MEITNQYKINIYEKWLIIKDLYNQTKDNKLISKIFEYYTCIKLSEEYKKLFYEYSDIDPDFRESNQMTQTDTGIDCCDLINTIVQCKLRSSSLNWRECGTFFGSQVIYDENSKQKIIRWSNLLIARNSDSKLSSNLASKSNLFIDKTYLLDEFVQFSNELITNPPEYPIIAKSANKLRDYQIECINLIKKSDKNLIVNLPTGTGKNFIIGHALESNKKYLILVPRIILMEQVSSEISKIQPKLSKHIQYIGDGNNNFDSNKSITICVYNSIGSIGSYDSFDKIFIDEAHHISKPEIYQDDDDFDYTTDSDYYSDDDSEYESESDLESDNESDDENLEKENDTEDEIDDSDNYIKTIRSLSKLNNNIYLSATIDEHKDFGYYKKDIRDMINQNYLCDYTIHIPIFAEDPTNLNICWHLIRNYSHIIIYCNSQKEGQEINKLMNQLLKGSSEYIDCKTNKKLRNKSIDKFKSGQLQFLVNVKILVEGFDAPITKGVCFIHLPSSKTTLVQIIGRALRLHPAKKLANIILPCSTSEDEKDIGNFMKVIAENDSKIRKSYQNKKLGGYICFDLDDEADSSLGNIIESRYEMIYDSIGKLINNEEIWMKKLEEVKQYIDKYKKKPSPYYKNQENNSLAKWLIKQIMNYKYKLYIMNNPVIYDIWNKFINDAKYNQYFLTNEKKWFTNFEQVKEYIDLNGKRPVDSSKDKRIKSLAYWIINQNTNYKTKIKLMTDSKIYDIWDSFINDPKYKEHFSSVDELWTLNLNEVKEYINKNNKRPTDTDKDERIKSLSKWMQHQVTNYKTKSHIFKNNIIYNKWTEFINDIAYKNIFYSTNEKWLINLEEVKQYINKNNKRPSPSDINKDIKQLGVWFATQVNNYNYKKNIMKEDDIYQSWTDFINDDKYKIYFEPKANKTTKIKKKLDSDDISQLEKELFG